MPVPKGYTLDPPQTQLPAGYTLDAPATTPPLPAPTSEIKPTPFLDKLTQIRPDNPNDSLGSRALNFVGNIGGAGLNTILNPVSTIKGIGHSLAHPEETVRELYDGLNTRPADTTAGLIGQSAVLGPVSEAAAPLAGKVMTGAGNAMQDAGARVINHTVGALTKDFKRGANPGQGYFQAGLGPSWSMDSIASKAADAHEATGAKLGSLYDSATKQGVTIPATKAASAIQGPVQDARSVISGPGGTGNTEPIDTFASSFKPSLQNAEQAGGYTPSELFGVKRNVAKNTSWGDPNQVGLKDVQQQTVGRLGGVLTDAVPDAGPLNSQYQNLYSLSDRAGQRAMTGSSPLTKIMAKASLGAGGALAGSAVSPTAGIASGLGAMALDSVPAKTTFASGLYYGGRGAAAIGNKLQSLYSPAPAAPTGASFAFDQKAPPQLESSVPGNAGYGQDFSKGGYAGRPPIVPNAPENLYRLPAATTPGETQPMLGNYIKRGGDVYGPEARTRIAPNKPISRTLQPQTQGLQLPQGAAQPLQLPAAASPGEAQPMVMQAKPTYPPLAQDFAKTRIVPNRTPIPTVKPTGGMTVDLYGNMKPNLNPVLELPAPRPKVAAKPIKK